METRIIVAGFGGQGILSAGRIIAESGLIDGLEVSWFPSYGPEMRGGTANCGVIVSDGPIGSPVLDECDILIAMSAPSLHKFEQRVRSGGMIILDRSLISDEPDRTDITLHPIEASRAASGTGNRALATVVLLGCLAGATGLVSRESFQDALTRTLPERLHHLIPAELEMFDFGCAQATAPS